MQGDDERARSFEILLEATDQIRKTGRWRGDVLDEDLLHDASIHVLQAIEQDKANFRSVGEASAFLLRKYGWLKLSQLRGLLSRPTEPAAAIEEKTGAVDDGMARVDHRRYIEQLLDMAPPVPEKPDRAILWLRMDQGMSFEEIAKELRLPLRTVLYIFYRVIGLLRARASRG